MLRRVVSQFFPGHQNVPLLQISPKQLCEAVIGNPDFDRDGFQLLVREFLPNHLPAPQMRRGRSRGDMILLVKLLEALLRRLRTKPQRRVRNLDGIHGVARGDGHISRLARQELFVGVFEVNHS